MSKETKSEKPAAANNEPARRPLKKGGAFCWESTGVFSEPRLRIFDSAGKEIGGLNAYAINLITAEDEREIRASKPAKRSVCGLTKMLHNDVYEASDAEFYVGKLMALVSQSSSVLSVTADRKKIAKVFFSSVVQEEGKPDLYISPEALDRCREEAKRKPEALIMQIEKGHTVAITYGDAAEPDFFYRVGDKYVHSSFAKLD